jgi:hypothetical protein
MVDSISTTQFIVKCEGSSMPVVDRFLINPENEKYVDLYLNNDIQRSKDVNDYSVLYKGLSLNAVEINDDILTVEFEK